MRYGNISPKSPLLPAPSSKRTGSRVRINGQDIYLGKYGSKESKDNYARLIAEHFSDGVSETVSVRNGDPKAAREALDAATEISKVMGK